MKADGKSGGKGLTLILYPRNVLFLIHLLYIKKHSLLLMARDSINRNQAAPGLSEQSDLGPYCLQCSQPK